MFTKPIKQIFTLENLHLAYEQISKASSGLDDITYKEFERELSKNLETLVQDVLKGAYSPEPLKKIEIKKSNKLEKRPIALSSIKDKVIQKVLYGELVGYFDKNFSDKSYAYRPGKSTLRAVNRTTDFLNKKYFYIVKTDIDDFFENINHNILLQILNSQISDKKITKLLLLFIKVGSFKNFDYDEHTQGVHQGDILSPLLSNIYLDMMDRYLEHKKVLFVRYADDFVMFFRTKSEAVQMLKKLKIYLKSMKLELGEDKTYITHISDGFTFLGVKFLGRSRSIDNEKLQKAISKIINFSKNSTGFLKFIQDLNEYLIILKNYYLKIVTKDSTQLKLLQNALIDSLSHKVYLSKSSKTITTKKEFRLLLQQINFSILFEDALSEYIELIIARGYEKYLSEKSYKDTKIKIGKKKNIYAKKFANDSTLHIASKGIMLGVSKNKFVLKKYGKVQNSYPVDRIKRIILEGKGFSLSSNVIQKCAYNDIVIDFIDKDALSYASLITYKSTLSQMVSKQAMVLNTPLHVSLAKAFVKGKAKNQLNYLKYLNKYHKFLDNHIKKIEPLIYKMKQVKTREELMGYEGSISASYWSALKDVLDIPFEKRITYGARDIVNSSLNYAYAILYGKVQRSLVYAGLSLNISFLHSLDEKKPTLTYDMIEEFRTFVVDRTIVSLLNKDEPVKLDSKGLLTKPSRQLIAKNIKEKLGSYTMHKKESKKIENIILSQAYQLAKVVNGEASKYKVFIGKY